MANSILYSEISLVCILFLILLCVKVRKSMFLQSQRNLFFVVAVLDIAFFAIDAVWIFADNNVIGVAHSMNWILNGSYYILSGVLGYFWFAYSETVQESKLVREKSYRLLAYIPIVVLTLLTLTSYKTGWLFYIDDQNVYHRGPAYVVQLLTSYGYVIFTAVKAFYLSFKTDDYHRKSDFRALASFVVPTLITGTLQVWFPGYPILCIGNTFGLLYVYVTMQEQLVSVDPLTKLNNRNQLMQYLSTKLTRVHEKKNLYLFMMDIDYFKSINDQYGHLEGDHALKIMANCLTKVCSAQHFFLSRYGGDEFIVVCELDALTPPSTVCDAIHAELRRANTPYRLSISIGYAKYTSAIKTQQELMALADAELYQVKKARKEANK